MYAYDAFDIKAINQTQRAGCPSVLLVLLVSSKYELSQGVCSREVLGPDVCYLIGEAIEKLLGGKKTDYG